MRRAGHSGDAPRAGGNNWPPTPWLLSGNRLLHHRRMHRPTLRIDFVGNARAPVAVIDDFHPDPQSLIAQAEANQGFSDSSRFYPGIRAQGSFEYVKWLCETLRSLMPDGFGPPNSVKPTECNYSLVTRRPEETIPFQRIPHFDGTDGGKIAVLHYLCRPEQGGTAFYRHRATGYEQINPANVKHYAQAIDDEMGVHGVPPPGYVNGSTALFERIAAYDAAFNRALVYRGTSLHSGSIPEGFVPDANPRTGRLTVNTFLELRAG